MSLTLKKERELTTQRLKLRRIISTYRAAIKIDPGYAAHYLSKIAGLEARIQASMPNAH